MLSSRLGGVIAEIIDISEGGLGVEIDGELRSGDFVRVLLPLGPDDDSSDWVDPDALVARVHSNAGSGQTRLGLTFFRLPKATLRRIAACVAQRLEEVPARPKRAAQAEPGHPTPSATVPPPRREATTREIPKAAPEPAMAGNATPKPEASSAPKPKPKPKPKPPPASKAPPLHIPRASARELRALFHEALASLEEDTGGKKTRS